ncbi:MAG: DUF4332 domain-containing protein [bacterium]
MAYLITEIIFCLATAALLGLLLGWLLRGILCRKSDVADIQAQLSNCMGDNDQLRSRLSTLTEKSGGISNIATANTPADEVVQLKALLEDITAERDSLLTGQEIADTVMADTQLPNRLHQHIEELEKENRHLNSATDSHPESPVDGQSQQPSSSHNDLDDTEAAAHFAPIVEDQPTVQPPAHDSEIHLLQQRVREHEEALNAANDEIRTLTDIISKREIEFEALESKNTSLSAATFTVEAGVQMDAEKTSYDIEEIEGIGAGFGRRLREQGVESTLDLLHKGATRASREQLSNATSIEAFIIRKWVSMADLIRIPGIRGQFAELLEASGVHSVQELAAQNAADLNITMINVNATEHRTPVMPTAGMVSQWVTTAQTLDAIIEI